MAISLNNIQTFKVTQLKEFDINTQNFFDTFKIYHENCNGGKLDIYENDPNSSFRIKCNGCDFTTPEFYDYFEWLFLRTVFRGNVSVFYFNDYILKILPYNYSSDFLKPIIIDKQYKTLFVKEIDKDDAFSLQYLKMYDGNGYDLHVNSNGFIQSSNEVECFSLTDNLIVALVNASIYHTSTEVMINSYKIKVLPEKGEY